MDFWQAVQVLKQNDISNESRMNGIGIRCELWANHPSKRFLYETGIDRTSMFGVCYFDPFENHWVRSWSVLMPMWDEMFESNWEVIQAHDFLLGAKIQMKDDLENQIKVFNYNRPYKEK